MNEEELQKALEEEEKRRQKEFDEYQYGDDEIRKKQESGEEQLEIPFESRNLARVGAGLAFEVGANSILDLFTAIPGSQQLGSAAINALAQGIRGGKFSFGELLASAAASQIPGLSQAKAITKAGKLARATGQGAVSGAIEATSIAAVDEGRLPTAQEVGLGVGAGGLFGAGFNIAGDKLVDPRVTGMFRDLKARINNPQSSFELAGTVGAARRKKISKSPGQMSLSDIDETAGMSEEALTELYLQRRIEIGDPPPSSPMVYKGKEGQKIARRLATRRIKVEDLEPILAERPDIPREKASEYIKELNAQRFGRNELNEKLKRRRSNKGFVGTITFLNQKAITPHTGSAEDIATEIATELGQDFTVQDLQKIINNEGTIRFKTPGMSRPIIIKDFQTLQAAYMERLSRSIKAPVFEEGHVFAVDNIIKDNNIISLANFSNNLEPEIGRSIRRQVDEETIQKLIDKNIAAGKKNPTKLKEEELIMNIVRGNRSRKADSDPDKVIADLYGTGYGLRESFLNFVFPQRSLNNIIPADLKADFAILYKKQLAEFLADYEGATVGPALLDKIRLDAAAETLKSFPDVDTNKILTEIINSSRIANLDDMVDPATGLLYGQ